MTQNNEPHVNEYDDDMVAMLELIWGKGFMAPGGAENVRRIVRGLDLSDKLVHDIGCGIGGGDLVLAGQFNARVIGVDLEAPLLERARRYAEDAGLAGRIEYRHAEMGPFAFDDETFDVVYSSGAFIHNPDKAAMFAEVKRVLKPGGTVAIYDWMCGPDPYSDDMHRWIELEGLTFSMETVETYATLLEQAGFSNVTCESDGGWYQKRAREECVQLEGSLKEAMIETLGAETYEHFLEDWRALIIVLDGGEMRPGYVRGVKAAT